MKKKVAVYPGTFDPVTLGHLDIIQDSSGIFDEVIVGLLTNVSKKPRFTEDERKTMIKEAVADLGIANVSVKIFKGLTVELAQQEKAIAIIRGLRLTTEYEDELNIVFNNRILGPDIVPILIPPRQEHIHISSSIVRELLDFKNSDLDKYVPQSVLEHVGILEERRKAKLREICRRLFGDAGYVIFGNLLARYRQPQRFYHGLQHITDCLDEFEQIRSTLHHPHAVEIAILFHDAVYDVCAKDNEEKSAELAKEIIKQLGLVNYLEERVAKLILATKHDIPPVDYDAKVIVDIDLASLGSPEMIFQRNTDKIRKEYTGYGYFTNEEFNKGRNGFLKTILRRDYIYLTPFFRDKYEAQAQKNLARAIARLSN